MNRPRNHASPSHPSPSHGQVSELLPWYVNGTLEGPELDGIESHLRDCESCRRLLAGEQRLAHALRTSEELAFSPERALGRLRDRLEDETGPDGSASEWSHGARRWSTRLRALATPVRWALAAQLAIIVLLAGLLLRADGEPAPFRTLSTPSEVDSSGVSSLRIVFNETASEGELRALLLESGCRIVAGPSRFGVYTVDAPSGDLHATIETLRSSPWVAFVEPGVPQP